MSYYINVNKFNKNDSTVSSNIEVYSSDVLLKEPANYSVAITRLVLNLKYPLIDLKNESLFIALYDDGVAVEKVNVISNITNDNIGTTTEIHQLSNFVNAINLSLKQLFLSDLGMDQKVFLYYNKTEQKFSFDIATGALKSTHKLYFSSDLHYYLDHFDYKKHNTLDEEYEFMLYPNADLNTSPIITYNDTNTYKRVDSYFSTLSRFNSLNKLLIVSTLPTNAEIIFNDVNNIKKSYSVLTDLSLSSLQSSIVDTIIYEPKFERIIEMSSGALPIYSFSINILLQKKNGDIIPLTFGRKGDGYDIKLHLIKNN